MSTTNLLFVPVVEEFEELPTDLVLYAPVSGTPRQIVEHFQNAMGTKPWARKAGGWNNLSEALQEATVLRPGRLVIKVQRYLGVFTGVRPYISASRYKFLVAPVQI